ncbi:hypothetical protein GCM10010400_42370 [Streptomyces aculeolatus]
MPVGERDEPGEGTQGGGLAGAVGAQEGDDVAGAGGERHVEPEGAALDDEPGVEPVAAAHGILPPHRNSAVGRAPSAHGISAPYRISCAHPICAPYRVSPAYPVSAACHVSSASRIVAHAEVIQRSRSPASTATDTASSTRLSAIAASGSLCSAR